MCARDDSLKAFNFVAVGHVAAVTGDGAVIQDQVNTTFQKLRSALGPMSWFVFSQENIVRRLDLSCCVLPLSCRVEGVSLLHTRSRKHRAHAHVLALGNQLRLATRLRGIYRESHIRRFDLSLLSMHCCVAWDAVVSLFCCVMHDMKPTAPSPHPRRPAHSGLARLVARVYCESRYAAQAEVWVGLAVCALLCCVARCRVGVSLCHA